MPEPDDAETIRASANLFPMRYFIVEPFPAQARIYGMTPLIWAIGPALFEAAQRE
jgi:hypothetical protein